MKIYTCFNYWLSYRIFLGKKKEEVCNLFDTYNV